MNPLAIATLTVSSAFVAAMLYVFLWCKISIWRDRHRLPGRDIWIEKDIDCESAWSESPALKDGSDDWRNECDSRVPIRSDEKFRIFEIRQTIELSRSELSAVENSEKTCEPKTPWG